MHRLFRYLPHESSDCSSSPADLSWVPTHVCSSRALSGVRVCVARSRERVEVRLHWRYINLGAGRIVSLAVAVAVAVASCNVICTHLLEAAMMHYVPVL